MAAPTDPARRPLARPARSRWACGARACPGGRVDLSPRAAHSPNADDIHTTYWVMLVVAVVLVVVDQRRADRRGRPLPRAPRPRARAAHGRARRSSRRVAILLGVLAVAVFVFGIVMTTMTPARSRPRARTGSPPRPPRPPGRGPRCLQAGAQPTPPRTSRNRQPAGAHDEPGDRRPAGDRRDRPAVAVALRVPGRPQPASRASARSPSLRPARRPRRHHRCVLNITSTDVLHSWSVPALGGQVEAVPGETSRPGSRPTRSAPTPALDRLLGHRLPGDAHLGAGRDRARVPGLRQAAVEDLEAAQDYVHENEPAAAAIAGGTP